MSSPHSPACLYEARPSNGPWWLAHGGSECRWTRSQQRLGRSLPQTESRWRSGWHLAVSAGQGPVAGPQASPCPRRMPPALDRSRLTTVPDATRHAEADSVRSLGKRLGSSWRSSPTRGCRQTKCATDEVALCCEHVQICGCDPKTVKRAVEWGQSPSPARAERPRNTDAIRDIVEKRVTKTGGRISAKRLLPEARAAGYESCCFASSPPPTNGSARDRQPLALRPVGPIPPGAHHRRQPARPAAPPRRHRAHRRRVVPHA